jgi:hypothetical protein
VFLYATLGPVQGRTEINGQRLNLLEEIRGGLQNWEDYQSGTALTSGPSLPSGQSGESITRLSNVPINSVPHQLLQIGNGGVLRAADPNLIHVDRVDENGLGYRDYSGNGFILSSAINGYMSSWMVMWSWWALYFSLEVDPDYTTPTDISLPLHQKTFNTLGRLKNIYKKYSLGIEDQPQFTPGAPERASSSIYYWAPSDHHESMKALVGFVTSSGGAVTFRNGRVDQPYQGIIVHATNVGSMLMFCHLYFQGTAFDESTNNPNDFQLGFPDWRGRIRYHQSTPGSSPQPTTTGTDPAIYNQQTGEPVIPMVEVNLFLQNTGQGIINKLIGQGQWMYGAYLLSYILYRNGDVS